MKLIYDENGTQKEFEIGEGQEVKVGREKDNTLQISHRSISKYHCEFQLNNGQIEIKDLGSSNGTFINGNKITDGTVGAGDSLRIGHVNCTVEGDLDLSGAAELDSGGTMIDENFGQMIEAKEAAPIQEGFGSFGASPAPSASVSASAASPQSDALMASIPEDKCCTIKVISGAPGQTVPIRQAITTIGTDPDCTLVVDAQGISAKHAEIVEENGKYSLRDLNSKNGVFVNREKVFEKQLSHGDSIQICGVRLAFDASATGASNSKLVPIVAGVIGLILLGAIIIKIAAPQPKNNKGKGSSAAADPFDNYKNLVNKAIEHIELRKYAEALTFLDEAKRKTPPNSSGALATTLKEVNANLWKEDQLKRAQLEDLERDLKKVQQLLRNFKWEQPKAFAKAKLEWTKKQITYSETIGEAKTAYAEAQYIKAINLLKKVPNDSILFNSELENTLSQWRDEHEDRLIKKARQMMKDTQFRQAIPILDEAQGVKRKYNTDIVSLRETCESNMEDATLLAEAKDRYSKGRNQEALSKLAKIKKVSLVYEEASKLRKEIYAIQVKDEILENYKKGNGEEALRFLSEVEDEELGKLEKKIRDVITYFDKLDEQRGYATPDRGIIRDAAKAIQTLEEDEENWYRQEAESALEEYGDVRGVANKMLGEARKFNAEKKYSDAKVLLTKILSLEDLEEDSPEKDAAKELLNEISGRVSREYLQIINARISSAAKAKRLSDLIKAVDKSDKYYLKIQKAIKKYELKAEEEENF